MHDHTELRSPRPFRAAGSLWRERTPFEKEVLSLFVFAFAKTNSLTLPKTFQKRKKLQKSRYVCGFWGQAVKKEGHAAPLERRSRFTLKTTKKAPVRGTYRKAVLYQNTKETRFFRPFCTRPCLQGIVCYTIFYFRVVKE